MKVIIYLFLMMFVFSFTTSSHNIVLTLKEVLPKKKELFNLEIPNLLGPHEVYERKIFADFITFYNWRIKKKIATRISEVIFIYSKKYNLDPVILLGIFGVESSYNYKVLGKLNEKGLGQILDSRWLAKKNKRNLYRAGIVQRGRPYQIRFIGVNTHATAYILSNTRRICTIYSKRRGGLRRKNYTSMNMCMIGKYNGVTKRAYFRKVTSVIGQYYFFVQDLEKGNGITLVKN